MSVKDPEPKLTIHDAVILESIFNPSMPFGSGAEATPEDNQHDHFDNETDCEQLEVRGIEAAEEDQLDLALSLFNQSIALAPERPDGYNNRAQLYRLKDDLESAKLDLERAIFLSHGHGKAARQAFTQRAMIRRLEGNEAGCRADFETAANLGSRFAKQQLVAINPYAAMCNSMLTEMVTKLRRGEPENNGDAAA